MKQTDIDRLKEMGFEVNRIPYSETFTISKKDHWDGVEFAKSIINGLIIKLPINDSSIHLFTPSTESEYVEQLKKEAKERFGEIKEGDRFERYWSLDYDSMKLFYVGDKNYVGDGFSYIKNIDLLMFNSESVYKSSQWAKKLPERVEVEYVNTSFAKRGDYNEYGVFFSLSTDSCKKEGVGEYLASQLEEYLNK